MNEYASNNDENINGEYTVSTATTIPAIEELREIWKNIGASPIASIDYFLSYFKTKKEAINPYVLLVSRNGHPETMLVGIVNEVKFNINKISIIKTSFNFRVLGVLIGGYIGIDNEKNARFIISGLTKYLKRSEVDAVLLQEINVESYLYRYARSLPGIFYCDFSPEIEGHFRMSLPANLESFYANKSGKQRNSFRRIVKKVEKKFYGKVLVKCFNDEASVDQFCMDAAEVSSQSWLSKIGKGFYNDAQTTEPIKTLANHGKFLGFILYIEDRPCAYEGGYIHENTYFFVYGGYKQDFRNYRVGTYLRLKIIDRLCNDHNFKYMDFGWMELEYKYRFCDLRWDEGNFYIFQPGIKGGLLNIIKVFNKKMIKYHKNWKKLKGKKYSR